MNALAMFCGFVVSSVVHSSFVRAVRIRWAELSLALLRADIRRVEDEYDLSIALGNAELGAHLAHTFAALQQEQLRLELHIQRLTHHA